METHRKFREPKLLLATNNEAKIRELSLLLNPFGIETISSDMFDIPEANKTGNTFQENSRIEALHYAKLSKLPALSDVSGLCVNALSGDPGTHSAQWAGPEQDYGKACERVQNELAGKSDRSAYFECVLTLAWPDGHTETFNGKVQGKIVEHSQGRNGFAYDPIFIPQGSNKTFAEMSENEKCIISHRALALESLIQHCLTE